ncbi:hypothetical protein DL93DRAFT_1520964 [Clavulina sp. PMI_390]|nr:hypothetical protein DL93DRAFT_1520964 [Clavulina sp. PMI_390]
MCVLCALRNDLCQCRRRCRSFPSPATILLWYYHYDRCKRLGSDCHFDPPNKGTLAARSAAAQNASNHQQQQQLQQSSYQQQQVPLQSIPLKNSVSLSPRSQHSRSSSSSAALSPAFFSRLLSSLPSEQQLQHADSDALLNSGFEHPTLPMYTYHESWGGNPGDMGRISRQLVPEAYETCIARVTIESAVHDWDVRYDPPGMVADYLVRCFIPFRRQFAFFWDASRLARRASLTPSEPDALHPALLNAMYLAACQQTKGALANFEHMLLARTKAYLDEAFATLADPYRFTHVLAASLLLVGWYLKAGRTMEAESAISSTVHYAVACGLHDPNSMSSSPPSIMLPAPSPSDEPELSDRRNLWYGIALVDNALSLGSGRTKAAPEKVRIVSLSFSFLFSFFFSLSLSSGFSCSVRFGSGGTFGIARDWHGYAVSA